MKTTHGTIIIAGLAALAACGSSPKDTPPAPPPKLTISASGVAPKSVFTGSAGSVEVTNADAAAHQLVSGVADPKCPSTAALAANQSGVLRFTTGPITCDYQDAAAPSDVNFHAQVNVAAPGTPGY